MIQLKQADTREELQQILTLQESNHVQQLTPEQKQANGFVTVKHNLELLTNMNNAAQQIIAKDGDRVVGYALVMLQEFRDMIPVLVPMFDLFDTLSFRQKKLSEYRYYVMGQICIAETHRAQGIFEQLYAKHKEIYSGTFDLCLTEVSTSNARSMKAHQRVGFQTIHTFEDQTDEWNILAWNVGSSEHQQ